MNRPYYEQNHGPLRPVADPAGFRNESRRNAPHRALRAWREIGYLRFSRPMVAFASGTPLAIAAAKYAIPKTPATRTASAMCCSGRCCAMRRARKRSNVIAVAAATMADDLKLRLSIRG